MNGKTDWWVRGLLVSIVILLAMHLLVSAIYPVGRYAALGSGANWGLLDTKTGTYYVPYEGKVRVVNLVERSKKQKKQAKD